MTNIDHDALARRIAERLARNGFILVPEYSTAERTMYLVEKCLEIALREALPTSEDATRLLFLIGCIRGSTPLVELIRGLNDTTLDECRQLIDLAMEKPEDEES